MRPQDEIKHRRPRRGAHQNIVDGEQHKHACCHFQAPEFGGDDCRQEDCPDAGQREDVSEDVAHLPPRRQRALPDGQRAPNRSNRESRPKQTSKNGPNNQCRRGDRSSRSKVAPKKDRPPRMNDQGLHPAFLPSHALPEPISELIRSFLPGVRIKRFHPVAEARQTNSEVRILGHVPLVPRSDPDQGSEHESDSSCRRGELAD